jgi:transposase InsO family protein
VNRFQFVAEYQRRYGVKRLCTVIGVARSSYYHWRSAEPARTARAAADAALTEQIRRIHSESQGTYGAPRVTAELRDTGACINHKRVARLMRASGIAGLRLRRRQATTIGEQNAAKAPDLLERDFTATTINTKYVGSGSRREFHPPAPTEPCVIVSH